jgi:ribose 5-phosphate isomerase B
LKRVLQTEHEIIDVGTNSKESCDYPVIAAKVCHQVVNGETQRGILICATGIGMSIAGNRAANVRTALCHDEFTARRARLHNDAQILALGSQVVDETMALKIVNIFLTTVFDRYDPSNSRHLRRLHQLETINEEK